MRYPTSIAKQICAYLKEHGPTTRPRLAEDLKAPNAAIESPMRKLLLHNMVVDTGKVRHHNGPNPCRVFALGPVPYSDSVYRQPPGRHKETANENLPKSIDSSLSMLESIIRSMVAQHADAQCEESTTSEEECSTERVCDADSGNLLRVRSIGDSRTTGDS